MPNKMIQLYPMSEEEIVKVKKLLATMGEFMEVKIEIVEVRSLAIQFDEERTDVGQVLGRLMAAKKAKKIK